MGFKSFQEKSVISFPPGISAIVGPNGCGKSNIVDALRWVMGEQSVKQLRGKSMEDVIFSGAAGKPPLSMAEVSLTLNNDNGSAPEELKDYTEIMMTRRLYRSGESAYFLNKQPCRLKDIHNVFLGSGMGAKSYAIIQQGNIGAITDAGPEERRYFLEEAAGTTRFKNRKAEALRKVQSTRQNLLRVSDIITEIQRQMAGLKRQAKKAERYKRYQQSIKELDFRLALITHDELTQIMEETGTLVRDLNDTSISHTSQLNKLDSAVEEIKVKRWQKNEEISEQKSRKFEAQRSIDRMENDQAHLRSEIDRLETEAVELEESRSALEEKNLNIRQEIEQVEEQKRILAEQSASMRSQMSQKRAAGDQIKSQVEELSAKVERRKTELMTRVADEARYRNIHQNTTKNRDNLQRRLKRIAEEAAQASKKTATAQNRQTEGERNLKEVQDQHDQQIRKISETEKVHAEKTTALAAQIKNVHVLELELNKARSRFNTLKKMEENLEWYKDGVKAILRQADQTEIDLNTTAEPFPMGPRAIQGLVADLIEPHPSYEIAVEAVLGESLQYILVENREAARSAIEYLQTSGTGRCGFIPLDDLKCLTPNPDGTFDESRLLLNRVDVKSDFEAIAKALLGHVIVASDFEEALSMFHRNNQCMTVVTKNGEVISRQGIIIGGSKEKMTGILAKRQELRDLDVQVQRMQQDLAGAAENQKIMEGDVRSIEIELQQQIEQKNALAQAKTEAEKDLYRTTEELKHARRHLEIIQLEHEQLQGEENDLDTEMNKTNAILTEIENEIKTAQQEVAVASENLNRVSDEMERFNQQVVDLKLQMTTLTARLDNVNNTLRRLLEFEEDGTQRLEQLDEDIQRKHHRKAASIQKTSELQAKLANFYEELKLLENSLETNETDYQSIDDKLRDHDGVINEIQSKREKVQEKIRVLELEQAQRNVQRDNVISRLEERYRVTLNECRSELKRLDEEKPEATVESDPEKLEIELERLRKLVARIGDVNLGAISEFEQLKSRFDFLCEQRDDLEKAIDDLQKVIKKINKITQERFLETFDKLNEKLKEVFPRLFEGGTAKLVLTQPDQPLETGVEYMIHPPGKKLTRMSLLSGGEKALAAIAFVFSLFLLKPAAFCLMDEIDAPLDEANVNRFNDLLRLIGEQSQIVMVTHKKRSMDFADTLFGITMETKGDFEGGFGKPGPRRLELASRPRLAPNICVMGLFKMLIYKCMLRFFIGPCLDLRRETRS